MAIDKRRNERTLVPSRNVRAHSVLNRIKSDPKYIPILRKRRRYSSSTSLPLSSLATDENLENGSDVDTLKVTVRPSSKVTRIRFKPTVQVAHIPSRFHYPELMKKSLWGNLKEITENARRNTIEFASEGWDWRAATEDDAMYVTPSGDRIHPAHVRRVFKITPTICADGEKQVGKFMIEDRIETSC